ncbi:hypothetical protein HH214_08305 [Mucilaginibacter robiniae]|uniref:Gluconolactonase n=1 Tax=Mucilaginibacter robiniae TaxID=2728022 RepID=A0A7L5DXZ1_9SPHI|nr:L-dopachrome tautomerase-related protein [Mucilaginibacter robiniae]QJD95875.1 hypothetical protein HH214_08305 [Mucilaginibacter robiniae]
MKIKGFLLLLLTGFGSYHTTHAQTKQADARLVQVYQSTLMWNGIVTSPDGRAFVCFPHVEGVPAVSIAEIKPSSQTAPYPDVAWNVWKKGSNAQHAFVRTNSLRFGPDGNLWIIDTGQPKQGESVVKDGPKLVSINTKLNKVVRIIPLGGVVKQKSFLDDFRFNGEHLYITDAGEPGLIVLDLKTGKGRRVLDNDRSTTDQRPMMAEGKVMVKANGKQERLHADQLELSPDGQILYFQPASGPMWRIETRLLDNPAMLSAQLAKQVKLFYNTPTTGGTCIDAEGNLYVTDANQLRILKITPQGQASTLIRDPRLLWADALWIDDQGYLWIPTNQQNRSANYKTSVKAKYPVYIYKMKLGAKPVRR